MDIQMLDDIYNNAREWIKIAGDNIRRKINDPLTVDTKSNPNDLVTTMDKETEAFFVSRIKEKYPDHFILGEEGYGDKLSSLDGTVWIIDPIDGTMNFVHQKRNFAISIGIYHDHIGEIGFVYDVMNDNLYHARRGQGAYKNDIKLKPLSDVALEQSIFAMNHFWLCPNRLVDEKVMQKFVKYIRGSRAYGSAALDLAFVAEGITDGYLSLGLSPWDIAAGVILVNEVGGVTTDIDGKPINMLEKSHVFASNPSIQEEVLQFIKEGRK